MIGGGATKSLSGRNLLQNFWYTIVGVRGPASGSSSGSGSNLLPFFPPDPLANASSMLTNDGGYGSSDRDSDTFTNHHDNSISNTTNPSTRHHDDGQNGSNNHVSNTNHHRHRRFYDGNFGQIPQHPIQEIAQHKVVFLGEVHSMPPIVAFQREVQKAMMNIDVDTSTTTSRSGGGNGGNLHVIMEHFSFELQYLLDEYMDDKIDFDTLVHKYHQRGSENHNLEPYRDLLEDAKRNNISKRETTTHHAETDAQSGNNIITNDSSREEEEAERVAAVNGRTRHIKLHAGFLPRKFARMLLKDGEEMTLQAASEWLPGKDVNESKSKMDLKGNDFHYNVFESLLSGRSLYQHQNEQRDDRNDSSGGGTHLHADGPSDQFRRIFQAQVLKDEAMAHRVSTLIQESSSSSSSSSFSSSGKSGGVVETDDDGNQDKFLVIAGNGHLLHYTGVPERVLRDNPQIANDTCLVISESTSSELLMPDNKRVEVQQRQEEATASSSTPVTTVETPDLSKTSSYLQRRFGQPGSNPADYVFFYEIPDEMLDTYDAKAVKEETKNAYDRVGDTAGFTGNALKAAWIMHNMGYSEQDYQTAGPDAYNFQGVGNPHRHANIQRGEIVLDVGSGLGVDSIIASHAVGPDGLVIGIDLSEKEVMHATKRATERGLENLKFSVEDMENMKRIPDGSIDVIISNGAFCLAPNKERAFAELYRVLRPGGRISVCTTTVQKDDLEPGVSWPLCMKMFIAKDAIKPMCERLGFEDVVVDDSDSRLSMDIPEEVLEQSNPSRNSVHVGGEEFKHLEGYDMDEICARVCVDARKPVNRTPTPMTDSTVTESSK
jgi:SAM-dependent methyltransferase